MSTGAELYEAITTGVLLFFAMTWLLIFDKISGETTLSRGIRAVFRSMAQLLIYGAVVYLVIIFFGMFLYPIYVGMKIEGAVGPDTAGQLGAELIHMSFRVPLDILGWIPLEVGVVAFALAFLHIVTRGEDYATN